MAVAWTASAFDDMQRLKSESVIMVEFFFGLQGLGTGVFTLSCWLICKYMKCYFYGLNINHSTLSLSIESVYICALSTLSCLPQIYACMHQNLELRHWSNFCTALFTGLLSVSLALGSQDGIAIAGYAFLSIATFYCFFKTSEIIKGVYG